MDQDTETTRKPLSTFKENIRGSLKSIIKNIIKNILATGLSDLHNYFDSSTKLLFYCIQLKF